jgi:quercetin dioxygenase-like cupin family protein
MKLLVRRRIIGQQAMISHVTLEKGCFVPMHTHSNEQFVCVLAGRMRFRLARSAGGALDAPPADGLEEVILTAGQVLLLPSNVPHEAEALERTIVLDVFSPPSAETGIDRFGRPS